MVPEVLRSGGREHEEMQATYEAASHQAPCMFRSLK